MSKTYNLYNLEAPFKEYLSAGNQKPVSIKNYLSDFRHFAGWFVGNDPLPESITSKIISEYKSYLESNNIPHKTINRRLSTLRKFCSFCISQGWMKENPAKKIGNISIKTVFGQRQSLNKAYVSPKKINVIASVSEAISSKLRSLRRFAPRDDKKLTSDLTVPIGLNSSTKFGLQHYVGFLIILIFVSVMGAGIYNQFFINNRQSFAYPTALTRAGRILSFQGRLTDSLSNPITTATNVVFQLYSVSSGGIALYTTGTCSVTPDQDGIFSSLIGSDCGAEITASVFTENANVYLGVTVGADAEMTPRQQIANVGYAINSETLQGLPPGSGTSNIPYINSQGNLLIAATNPGLHSTYASSTFTISSAQATTIQSAGTGDIVLQATESGALKFRTAGSTDTENRLVIDNTGTGTFTGNLVVQGTAGLTFNTGAGGDITFANAEKIDNDTNGTINITTGTLKITGGTDLVSDQASVNLFNATTTTLTVGGALTTLDLLDSVTTKTVDIGGVTNSGTDTISISTNGTAADTLAIGNNNASTLLTLTGGDDWNITNTGVLTLSASAAQTTAIDATDTSYTNALSVGDNNIIGTTGTLDYTYFDVDASGNTTIDNQGDLRLSEPDGAGANYVGLQAPDTLAGDTVYKLPNAFPGGASGYYLTSNTTGDMSWSNSISASSLKWNALTDPDGDLNLTMAANNSIFNWDPGADTTETSFSLTAQGEDTTGTGDQDQILLSLAQTTNGASDVDEGLDALLTLTNDDGNDMVQNAIRFDTGAAGTDFTYGINFDAADIGTAELKLENAEQIHNQTDGTITFEDGSGTDYATLSSTTLTALGDLVVQGTTGLTFNTGAGGDITFANAEKIDNDTNGTIAVTGDLDTSGTLKAGTTDAFSVDASGNTTIDNQGDLRLSEPDGAGANFVGLQAPDTLAGDTVYKLPNAFPGGASGYYLTSNTTGDMSWSNSISASSLKWNALTDPDGALTLAMGANATTWNWDSLTTGTGLTTASTSLSSGNLASLSVNSTAAASNTQKVLNISTAGANGTTTQTTYGLYSTNTHTGTASTNVAGYFSASGGSNNYGLVVENGNAGIGTTTPAGKLDVTDTSNTSASLSLTNNTATTIGVGVNTLGVLDLQSTSLTTGNFLNLEVNALTSGKGINLTSSSTGLTTGSLLNVVATGDPGATWTGSLGLFEYSTSTDIDIDGSALKVGITGAGAGDGTALNVTTGQTGTSALALRVNDDGTYSDSTPFVVDYAGNVGIGTATPGAKLDIGGASSTISNTSGDITIDAAGTKIDIADDLEVSGVLQVGNFNPVTYSRFGSNGTGWALSGASDVLISGDLEVDGQLYVDGASSNYFAGTVGINDLTPDAKLDIDSTSTTGGDLLITNTGIGLSGSVAGITADSVTTGDLLTISGTSLTTGSALVLTGPTSTGVISGASSGFVEISSDIGSGGTLGNLLYLAPDFSAGSVTSNSSGIRIVATDSTNVANSDLAYYGTLTLTGNAAKSAYGISQSVSSNSTTADLIKVGEFNGTVTGGISTGARSVDANYASILHSGVNTGGTTSLYGYHSTINENGANSGGTHNLYGSYNSVNSTNSTTGSTVNMYGSYITSNGTMGTGSTGTINQYGIYIADGTSSVEGSSTKYGLYIASPTGADTNYAAILQGNTVIGDGSAIGDSLLTLSGTNSDNDAALTAVKSDGTTNPVFSVLPWDSGIDLTAGVYFSNGAWVHNSDDTNSQIFIMDPGAGVKWYASSDSSATWNEASNSTLWNSNGYWKGLVQSTATGDSYFTGGNVGIGEATPRQNLSIGTGLDIYSGAVNSPTTPSIRGVSTNGNLQLSSYGTGALYLNYDSGTGGIRFHAGTSTEVGSIDSSGNLQIDGDITVSGGNINTGDINLTIGDATTNLITFTTDGTGTAEIVLPNDAISTAEILDDTIDFDNIIDSMALDAALTITGGAGEEITISRTLTDATNEQGLILSVIGQDTTSAVSGQYGLYVYNAASASNQALDAVLAVANIDADITPTSAIALTAGGAGTDFTYGLNFNTANVGTAEIVLENAEYIENQVNGTVAITDGGGTGLISVSTTTLTMNLSGADAPERLCHSGADASRAFVDIGDCAVSGADFAEYSLVADIDAEPGDLVFTVGNDPFDSTKTLKQKSSFPYQNITGVISTNPFVDILGETQYKNDSRSFPIALRGKAPVKISLENGPIKVGDPLISSSIPGVAMKATKPGEIIGFAEENFDGTVKVSSQVTYQEQVWSKNRNGRKALTSDSSKWSQDVGKIIVDVNPHYYDPGIYLTSTGDLEINNVNQTPYVYDGNPDLQNQISQLRQGFVGQAKFKTGEIINRIGAFSELVTGKIKAGLVETENMIVDNTLLAKNIISETVSSTIGQFNNLTINNKITSPVVETENITTTGTAQLNTIKTNEIKPAEKDVLFDLSNSSNETNESNGNLAKLIIKGLEGKSAVVIDAAGNVYTEGDINAQSASFSGQIISDSLTTNEATISGTLIAKEIKSETIDLLSSNISSQSSTLDSLSSNINDVQKLIADIQNQPIPNLTNETNLTNTSNLESLTVTGNSNLYNVSVSNSLLVGTTLIDQNSIISLASELKLSALSTINLLDGAVIIAKDGTITTKGELIAEGGIRTDTIKPLTNGGQVTINNLAVNNLTINNISTNSAVIAAPDNFARNGIFAPAIETATTSAGLAILPENSSEIVIYNNNIKENSLIYLTPTSSTTSVSQLTVGQKSTSDKPYFKVVTNTPSTLPIKFNWLIIN